ncbi:hypothetical protein R84981_003006 [Carnimonas sp. R-84981]
MPPPDAGPANFDLPIGFQNAALFEPLALSTRLSPPFEPALAAEIFSICSAVDDSSSVVVRRRSLMLLLLLSTVDDSSLIRFVVALLCSASVS